MNINPVSLTKNFVNIKNSKNIKQSSLASKPQQDTVSFTGSKNPDGFKRAVAGLAAALGILTICVPKAQAASQENKKEETSIVYQIETPVPSYNQEEHFRFPVTNVPSSVVDKEINVDTPINYDNLTGLSEDEIAMGIAADILPKANIVKDNDDLIIALMKYEANSNALKREAVNRRNTALDYYSAAMDSLMAAKKSESGTSKYSEKLGEVDSYIDKIVSQRMAASAMDRIAGDYDKKVYSTQNKINAITSKAPALPMVSLPPFPVVDTKEMLMGYDKTASQVIFETIPEQNIIKESDSMQDKLSKKSANDALLFVKAKELILEAQKLFVQSDIDTAQLRRSLNDREVSDKDVESIMMGIAFKRAQAGTNYGLAAKLENIASSDSWGAYIKSSDETEASTSEANPGNSTSISDSIAAPVPSAPPIMYPIIDTVQDFMSDEEYKSFVGASIHFRDDLTHEERIDLLAKMSENSKKKIEALYKEADELESEVKVLWNKYYTTGEGSKQELQNKVNKVATLGKNAENEERRVKVYDEIVETGVFPPAPDHLFTPGTTPPLPTIPDFNEDGKYDTEAEETKTLEDMVPPVPTQPQEQKPIACTFEDIMGSSYTQTAPVNPVPPVPTQPQEQVIACTIEDILGISEEELKAQYPQINEIVDEINDEISDLIDIIEETEQ